MPRHRVESGPGWKPRDLIIVGQRRREKREVRNIANWTDVTGQGWWPVVPLMMIHDLNSERAFRSAGEGM